MATVPPPPPAPPGPEPTSMGMAANVAGLLCYAPCCIGLIFSVIAVVVEKQSRFLRFHAFQSLLFHAAIIVLSLVLQVGLTAIGFVSAMLAFIGSLLSIVFGLAILAANIFLMVKAYGYEEFELPTLGQMARRWV